MYLLPQTLLSENWKERHLRRGMDRSASTQPAGVASFRPVMDGYNGKDWWGKTRGGAKSLRSEDVRMVAKLNARALMRHVWLRDRRLFTRRSAGVGTAVIVSLSCTHATMILPSCLSPSTVLIYDRTYRICRTKPNEVGRCAKGTTQ